MLKVTQNDKFDDVLYLHQIYTIGYDTLEKLSSSSVLISGMGGLGVEIAKNIILIGVKNVTIHDTCNTEINDLASNFYLSEKSIGKNRATESYTQLLKLSKNINLCVKTESITNDLIKQYDCFVITDFQSETEIHKISTFCHQNHIKLIITETRGLFAYIFNDFGTNFVVTDPENEPSKRLPISNVTKSEHGLVTIDKNVPCFESYNLYDGDHVTFEEMEGMTELNGKEYEIKVIDHRHFTIGDTRSFNTYISNHHGFAKTVVVPQKYDFLEFTEALQNASTHQNQDRQVLLSFIAAQHSLDKSGKRTREVSGEELFESAKEVNSKYRIVDEIDEKIIREFARESSSVICPMCSIFGGIAGQEIIKCISSKYFPIHQFFAMECTSCLPTDTTCELKNDRYDAYRVIFGNKQQEKMESLRYLLAGLGSMGCEYLKNFLMMGVATNEKVGHLYISDCKLIKKSDLSQQFLYRKKDVGKKKDEIAIKSIHEMNPNINITPIKLTEITFNDYFYENIDGICNAINNSKTLHELDDKSVFIDIPQIISVTNGLKASYQDVVPKITECYSDFPEIIERHIELSGAYWFPDLIDKRALIAAKQFYFDEKCENFFDCIKWARKKFDDLFVKTVKISLNSFQDNNLLHQRFHKLPILLNFDPRNQDHAKFVTVAALLRARVCQIEPQNVDIPQIASDLQISENPYFSDTKSDLWLNEDISELSDEEANEKVNQLIEIIGNKRPKPESYLNNDSNDDDFSNICFIFIESTIRIRTYSHHIKTEDKFAIKKLLRKFNPSIITTSSMISGLASLEMYKIHCIDCVKNINDFRSGLIDLASSNFCFFEPMMYKTCNINGIKNSIWDKYILDGDITIDELIKKVSEKYKLKVDFLTYGNKMFYSNYNEKSQKRLTKKISDVLINEFGCPPFNEQHYLIKIDLFCCLDDENDYDFSIFVRIKK